MGVEPTRAAFKHPSDGFEDRGAHQDSTTPTSGAIVIVAQERLRSKLLCRMARVAKARARHWPWGGGIGNIRFWCCQRAESSGCLKS